MATLGLKATTRHPLNGAKRLMTDGLSIDSNDGVSLP
jgi:hypothetical protein